MKPRIATLDGIFVLDESGFYEPYEPDPEVAHPGLILIALVALGWAAFAGIAYCLWQVVQALAG